MRVCASTYLSVCLPICTQASTYMYTHVTANAHAHTADGRGQLRLEPPQNKAAAVLDEGFGGGIELIFRQLLREDPPFLCVCGQIVRTRCALAWQLAAGCFVRPMLRVSRAPVK